MSRNGVFIPLELACDYFHKMYGEGQTLDSGEISNICQFPRKINTYIQADILIVD